MTTPPAASLDADFKLFEPYQKFSGELVKIGLVGIAYLNFMKSAFRLFAAVATALFACAALRAQSNYATPYPFTTFAGNAGYGAADGTGHATPLYSPQGVAMDSLDNVSVAAEQSDLFPN